MKSPKIAIAAMLTLTPMIVSAQGSDLQTYTANPVYNSPSIAENGQSSSATGTWSPIGLDPMGFSAIVSLAYTSESTYSLQTTQVTGTGTGVGATDSYIYRIVSDNPTIGDVVNVNINYTDIDQTGPEPGIIWDQDPAFKVNRAFTHDNDAIYAILTEYSSSQEHSVFDGFSSAYTITANENYTGSDPTSLSSDGVIFISAKEGPVAWSATEAVPEPSSALLLGLGGLFALRRKR